MIKEITRPRARVEAYGKVISLVKQSFAKYARDNPDFASDPAWEQWVDHIVEDIGEIFNILDSYDINYKSPDEDRQN